MQLHLRRSIDWITSRPEWWLALALIAAYGAVLVYGSGRTRFHALCALPPLGALLLTASAKRHRSTFALLSAAAIAPPAITLVAYLLTPRSPHAHPCNPTPFLIVAWLLAGVGQVATTAVLAVLFRLLMRFRALLRSPAIRRPPL